MACAAPGPYPPDWSRWNSYGASSTGSSRTASRLACRTRTVWQYQRVPSLSGLLTVHPARLRSWTALSFADLLRQASGRVVSPLPGKKWWRLVAHKAGVPHRPAHVTERLTQPGLIIGQFKPIPAALQHGTPPFKLMLITLVQATDNEETSAASRLRAKDELTPS